MSYEDMNGDHLTSTEARSLKDDIKSLGTTVLRAIGDVKSTVNQQLDDHAEILGKVMTAVTTTRDDMREVKRVLRLDDGAPSREAQKHVAAHAARKHAPKRVDRHSLPPELIAMAKELDDIEVTDTGTYRIPPGALENISQKIREIETKEKDAAEREKIAQAKADALAEQKVKDEAEKERLSKRITLVMKICGGIVGFVTTAVAAFEWIAHHVH